MADNTVTAVFTADTSDFNAKLQDLANSVGTTLPQAAQKGSQSTSAMFKSLESASDKAVSGLVRGTETWHQAMLSVITDLEVKFAQLSVNDLLNVGRDQLQKLSIIKSVDQAAVDSNTEKNAATKQGDATANAESATSNALKIIKQIQADAAATYAGVYAFFSPVLGPAAAIPAGISAGSVAAMEGLVSLDVGAWNVPSNMPAFLHAGEMVVPANFASGLRNGGGINGGSGDNYTINVNAVDTQTGAQFLKNNAAVIASAISSQVRSFNRNVPAWKS